MRKLFALILALALVLSLAACGSNGDSNPSEEPEPSQEVQQSAPAAPRIYKYEEDRGDFVVTWTLTLIDGGMYSLDELSGLSGNQTSHGGTTWTDNGDGTITTGPWAEITDKSEFFEADGSCTWIVNDDGTMTPANASDGGSEGGINPGKYTYEEDRGDFKVVWDVMLMGNGAFTLSETHGLSGNITEHTGAQWTDNGNGTVTTGAWDDPSGDKSEFFAADGACTWVIHDDGTCEPGEAPVAIGAGKYTYVDGDTTWEIKVMGNGTCVVSEINTATGDVLKEHTTKDSEAGNGWTDNGDGTFESGEWFPEEREDNKVSLASPNGVTTWKLVDAENSLVEPIKADDSKNAVSYGRYTYHDAASDTDWSVMIMGNGECTLQPNDADGNPLMNDEGHPFDHKTKGFKINGDGTFTTFAMEDTADIPEFLSGEDGMTTWKIVDADKMIVEIAE